MTVWPVPFVDQAPLLRHLQDRRPRGLGVEMRRFFGRTTPYRDETRLPLEAAIERPDRLLLETPSYGLYRLEAP
jgi:hypothetical protein